MHLSDRRPVDFLALAVLVAFPPVGTAWGLWSWVWEIIILLAVYWSGTRKSLATTAILLAGGYGLAALIFRLPGLEQMGFLPWAGLLTLFGWERKWPRRVNLFWSLALAGLLGALPMIGFAQGNMNPQVLQQIINASMQSYQSSGMLATAEQLGFTADQLRSALEQVLPVYISLIPAFAAIMSFVEYGLGSYLAARFIRPAKRSDFTHWRLPWYAVWGVILALICYLAGDQFGWPLIKGFGLNLMVAYVPLTLIIGFAVYAFVLRSPKIPRFVKWGLLMINLFYFFFSLVLLMMFGLFDLVLNFRKLPETEN